MPPKFDLVPGLSGPPAPSGGSRANVIQFFNDPLRYLGRIHGRYGRVAAITRGDPFLVSALGPEFNKQILSDGKQFFTVGPSAVESVAQGPDNAMTRLLVAMPMSNGPRHQQQRKLIMPALHHNALVTYLDQMVSTTLEIVDGWKAGQQIDLFAEMKRITLRIAMKVLLGIVPEEHGGDALVALYEHWMELNASMPDFLYARFRLPGSRQWRLAQVSEKLEKKAKAVIEHKRKNPGRDVVSMLIQAADEGGAKLSEAELVANTHVLFIIGYQTMTDLITWTLFCLSQHPQMLGPVREEVDGVLKGAAPTYAQLDQLKLLNWSIDEALRLLGPVVYQVRVAQERFVLGPVELPKGAWVIFNPHYTHRMAETFQNPNRYQPLRWETAKPTTFEFLPFTFGAHGCIGPQFAYTEMKIILSLILQRFQPALAPNARVDWVINPTLAPAHGMPMTLLPRGAPFQRNLARGNIHEILELV